MQKEVSVDHITPWGYIWESTLMDAWSRLLVAVSQLQVLCKPCHDRKTESEAVMK
jgi:5-methylcytosine-specific restriction endonuclease McrA